MSPLIAIFAKAKTATARSVAELVASCARDPKFIQPAANVVSRFRGDLRNMATASATPGKQLFPIAAN
jgi:hypothetical protein